jgi:hypothetical protein
MKRLLRITKERVRKTMLICAVSGLFQRLGMEGSQFSKGVARKFAYTLKQFKTIFTHRPKVLGMEKIILYLSILLH